MTFVEFFDKSSIENVCTCLLKVPDRIVLMSNDLDVVNKYITHYKKVFADRGYDIEILPAVLHKNNYVKTYEDIKRVIEKYDDCLFDITGGDEIAILALGELIADFPEKNIQIHKYNLRSNTIVDCDKDGNILQENTPMLTVQENIRIYGGEVVYGDVTEDKTYNWDMSPEFLKDLNAMWKICIPDVHAWNKQISMFKSMVKAGTAQDDGLSFVVRKTKLEQELNRDKYNKNKYKKIARIINGLVRVGLMTHFDDSDEQIITLGFKNHQVRRCLTKEG